MANAAKKASSKKIVAGKVAPTKTGKDAKKTKASVVDTKPKFAVGDLVTLKGDGVKKSPGEAPVVSLFVGDGVSGPLGKQMYRVGRDPFYNSYEESQLVLVKAGKKVPKAFRVGDKVVDRAVPTVPLRGKVMEIQGDMAYVGTKKASIAYPVRDLIPFHSKEARELGIAYEIRRAFAVAHNQPQTVGVARATSPKELFGFVERINVDMVTVRVSDAIEKEIDISKLVLFSQPKAKAADVGSSREQNAGYPELARDFVVGAKVSELSGKKRTGVVAVAAASGSGFMDVLFEGDATPVTKHVSDLKLTSGKKPKFSEGDLVSLPKHGKGVVYGPTKTPDMIEVDFDHTKPVESPEVAKVHQDELTLVKSAKDLRREGRAAGKKAAELKMKLRFEDIGIFGGFVVKNRTFVKVSKSNGIPVVINGTADEPFAMLATSTTKIAPSSIQRFKKSDRVLPYAGVVTKHEDRTPLPADVVGTSGPGGVHAGGRAEI